MIKTFVKYPFTCLQRDGKNGSFQNQEILTLEIGLSSALPQYKKESFFA